MTAGSFCWTMEIFARVKWVIFIITFFPLVHSLMAWRIISILAWRITPICFTTKSIKIKSKMTIKSKKAQLESMQNSSFLIKVCANHSFTEALGREGINVECSYWHIYCSCISGQTNYHRMLTQHFNKQQGLQSLPHFGKGRGKVRLSMQGAYKHHLLLLGVKTLLCALKTNEIIVGADFSGLWMRSEKCSTWQLTSPALVCAAATGC